MKQTWPGSLLWVHTHIHTHTLLLHTSYLVYVLMDIPQMSRGLHMYTLLPRLSFCFPTFYFEKFQTKVERVARVSRLTSFKHFITFAFSFYLHIYSLSFFFFWSWTHLGLSCWHPDTSPLNTACIFQENGHFLTLFPNH